MADGEYYEGDDQADQAQVSAIDSIADTDNIRQFVASQATQTRARVVQGLDQQPDEAARTLDLSQQTGVPAPVISGDTETFEKQHRSVLAQQLVMNNPELRSYVASHPLAASISADDWGNLDKFSQGASGTQSMLKALNRPWDEAASGGAQGAIEGWQEGFGNAPLTTNADVGKWIDPTKPPFGIIANQLATMGINVGELATRGMSGLFGAMTGAVGGAATGAAKGIGASPEQAAKFGQDLRGMAELEMIKPEAPHVEIPQPTGRAWVDAGKEPPRGISPELDAAKAQINAHLLDQLDTDLSNAQASLTKERSPEMFSNFVEQHYGNSTIGIHADAATALYGDKPPTPDDGLLGWSVGINDKLDLARATGADVEIPIKDWISNVDPAVAKQLHDDIRVWPGGVTAREALDDTQPKMMVDSALAQTRGAAGLEPMFSIGDRKLQLMKTGEDTYGAVEGQPEVPVHLYDMLDENGAKVGEMHIVPNEQTKQLLVDWVGGQAGRWANSFGPSLVRDMMRQLKAMYPDYTELAGYRVSGAREAAGKLASASVKMDLEGWDSVGPNEFQSARRIFSDAYTDQGNDVSAQVVPTDMLLNNEKAIHSAVSDEVAKITGRRLAPIPTSGIRFPGIENNVRGAFLRNGSGAKILYDLYGEDPIGTGRHETIHFLRDAGLITPAEWGVLSDASLKEDWQNRYNIPSRYQGFHPDTKVEESIAEAFREWTQHKDEGLAQTPVGRIFQKLSDFFDAVRARIAKIFGYDPSFEELFQRIASGEVGERGTVEGQATQSAAMAQAPEEGGPDFGNLTPATAGLDAKSWERIKGAINARNEADIAAATARAEREQSRRQTKEWKDNSKEMATEVEAQIRQRPDVAADLFLGSGELFGQKLRQRYTLKAEDLTAEQKAALPKHYVSRDGLPIDEVARIFGYGSGDAMVERLSAYNGLKGDRTPQEMLKDIVKDETSRRMEMRYGNLGQNIMDEAKDQALSETGLNLVAEEYQALAMQIGQGVINKDLANQAADEAVKGMTLAELNSDKLMTVMGRHGRDSERSLLAGDPASALVSMQKKYLASLVAKRVRAIEKDVARFDKLAKTLVKRELPSVDPEYMNYIHQILQRIGKPVRRSIQGIQEDIDARGTKTLQDFVATKTAAFRELPVWDQLYDDSWRKEYKTLTTDEFNAIHGTIKALHWNGRDELKITKAGEAADLEEIKGQMKSELRGFAEKKFDTKGEQPGGRVTKAIRTYGAQHMQLETIFNRWDRYDPQGVWNQYVMRDLIDGANQEDAWKKEFAGRLAEAGDKEDMSKLVDNSIFREPREQGGPPGPLLTLNRGNLRAILLNAGNSAGSRSNLVKLAKGYGLEPQAVMAWLHQHATKEDWEFAQKVWDIFKEIKGRSDTMYRSLTGGVAPDQVRVDPIQTPFGTYAGGYYPIIYHPNFEQSAKSLKGGDPLEQSNYVRATTPAGYTETRTGYSGPLALDLDMLPNRISQQLHDIAMRPAVINASKVFYDKGIQQAVRVHYGNATKDLLIPYLRDVANSANYMSRGQKEFAQWSEFIRQNMISTLVGLNPGTVLKHGPTAWVQSMKEVGSVPFLKAVKGLFSINEATGENNWQFAIKNSLELQRRDRNYAETLSGATEPLQTKPGLDTLRQKIIQLSSKPVALSDLLSAVPTWSAAYEKAISEAASHGDAVYLADRAVRRAHGSTAATNRPAIMRDANPWFTSVYSFFNHIMNRQVEMVWKAGEVLGAAKAGDLNRALAQTPGLAGQLFAYVLFPAMVEEAVSPLTNKDNESWGKKAGKAVAYTLGSSWVGVRDFAHFLVSGHDPAVGLFSTAYQTFGDVARDLQKNQPLNKDHAARLVQHAARLAGLATGLVPEPVGPAARFVMGVHNNLEHPKGPWGWLTGLRYGTLSGHSGTFSNYMQGKQW